MNNAQLLQGCLSGDESAVEALVKTYRGALYRLAYSILLDTSEAEEAVQDAFIAALRGLDGFQGGSLSAWLYAITLNGCRKRLRRGRAIERIKHSLKTLLQVAGIQPSHPENAVIELEADDALWQAVRALDEKYRVPVILYYYHDLPVSEIANLLDLAEGTVHSRLFTAREKLRKALRGEAGFPAFQEGVEHE